MPVLRGCSLASISPWGGGGGEGGRVRLDVGYWMFSHAVK